MSFLLSVRSVALSDYLFLLQVTGRFDFFKRTELNNMTTHEIKWLQVHGKDFSVFAENQYFHSPVTLSSFPPAIVGHRRFAAVTI